MSTSLPTPTWVCSRIGEIVGHPVCLEDELLELGLDSLGKAELVGICDRVAPKLDLAGVLKCVSVGDLYALLVAADVGGDFQG